MDEDLDRSIARHIVSVHKDGDKSSSAPFTTEQLYNYIRFGRTIKPVLTEAAQKMLVQEYKKLRLDDTRPGQKSAYRITVRQLESMVRLSEALARVHLEAEVRPEYVKEAARLLRRSIIHVENKDLVLMERPGEVLVPRELSQEAEDADGELPKKEKRKIPQEARTISYREYQQISNLVCLWLRGCEARGEPPKTFQDIVNYYLEHMEEKEATDKKREFNDAIIRLVLSRLIKKDNTLIELVDDADPTKTYISVHPNVPTD